MSERKVSCAITGQELILGKSYFEKKVQEYGSAENLKSFYISKKAKQLLMRGYSVAEIRKILEISDSSLPAEDSTEVSGVLNFHKAPDTRRLESNLNFSMQNSDPEVAAFINNIT